MRSWQKVIPAGDRDVHEAAGYGKRIGLGTRPATLIVDVNYQFLGRRPEPILRSVTLWPKSSGERGWATLPRIQRLLALSRAARIPVLYTTGQTEAAHGPQFLKSRRDEGPPVEADDQAIVEQVAPVPGEVVVAKPGPSPFFGTGLLTHLVQHGVDTLLLAGCTTSGCVRATAVDAATHGFRVGVVEECVFDRFEISHAVALFDLNAKYGDVIQLADVERYLEGVPVRNGGYRTTGCSSTG